MQLKSIGLIETNGLATGIEAADAAVKSANVELLGYELSKGGGWTTVKIQGDVGAVKAAIDAAKSLAMRGNGFVSAKVIPRPSASLCSMLFTGETVGYTPVQTERVTEETSAPSATEETVEPVTLLIEEVSEMPEPSAAKTADLGRQPSEPQSELSTEQKKPGKSAKKRR